jgi:hypothetical protein
MARQLAAMDRYERRALSGVSLPCELLMRREASHAPSELR